LREKVERADHVRISAKRATKSIHWRREKRIIICNLLPGEKKSPVRRVRGTLEENRESSGGA